MYLKPFTTFIIPSINRLTLYRAIGSANDTGQPVLYKVDSKRIGESYIRNELIQKAETEWLSFLDDDDAVLPYYPFALQYEIDRNPHADLIIFRQYFCQTGQTFPNWPSIKWGNVGISFSVKRGIALKHPFIQEDHEDLHFVERVAEAGYNVVFSKELVYLARPNYTW